MIINNTKESRDQITYFMENSKLLIKYQERNLLIYLQMVLLQINQNNALCMKNIFR